MKLFASIALVLLLTGCASPTGVAWYNPTTWFSGSEARKVERTQAKLTTAEESMLKAAQHTAHETQLALVSAPHSRHVEVARESNDTTVSALDQLAGPLTIDATAKLRAQVAGLLSEVADVRAAAESERRVRRDEIAEASATIDQLTGELRKANAAMKEGFERENSLANQLRNQRFWLYGAIIVGVLGFIGMTYLRLAYGGIPQAIGRGLSELRSSNPEAGKVATQIFDGLLNRAEQQRIKNAT